MADYGFKVVPGPLAVFGPITIAGLDPDGDGPAGGDSRVTAPARHRHPEGTPYSTAEIDSATQALLDLGVFSAVEIVPTLADPRRSTTSFRSR